MTTGLLPNTQGVDGIPAGSRPVAAVPAEGARHAGWMMRIPAGVAAAVRPRWKGWLAIAVGVTFAYYVLLLAALVVRFGDLPNYVVGYDWFGNVARIVASTPSVADMVPIILGEWVLEIGFMTYDYGLGLSVWSLNLIPMKVAVVALLGAAVATNWALLQARREHCSVPLARGAEAATGVGALMVAATSATMTWVVCCATPSWVVGLAMLGLGVSTSLALEPVGPWLAVAGFACLAGTAVGLSRGLPQPGHPRSPAVGEGSSHV